MMGFKNKFVKEIFHKVNGNQQNFHNLICKICNKDPSQFCASSVYWRGKQVLKKSRQLFKHQDKTQYFRYLNTDFQFPRPSLKRKLPISNSGECVPSKKFKEDAKDNGAIIDALNRKIFALKEKIRSLNPYRVKQQLKRKDDTIQRLRNNIKVLRRSEKAPKCKDVASQCNTLRKVITDLKTELDQALVENLEWTDGNNNHVAVEKVIDFRDSEKGKPYSSKIRKLYYFMRSRNVALEHIAPIIREVFGTIDVDVYELPTVATAAKITNELGIISRQQLEETLLSSDSITMHRDATTKKGRHFYGIEFSTDNSNTSLTAGLREVKDGKASTYVKTTMNVLQDITTQPDEILSKIDNFMTDRSATEQKVNNDLVQDESNRLGTDNIPNSFKCSVHPLLQFEDVCKKELSAIESECNVSFDKVQKNESISYSLLRFVSKLFFKDSTGDPLLTTTYLNSIGIHKVPILCLRGNRFNTLFYNSAGTYYLRAHLRTYLQSSKSSLNFVQSFILQTIQDNTVLGIIRALGIISKCITEPYWRKAGGEIENALLMGTVYRRLVDVLFTCYENPSLIYKNEIKLFYGPDLPLDDVTTSLFQDSPTKNITILTLKKCCRVMHEKAKSLFKDFLPNGKFFNPSENLQKSASSCPPNNITVERLMARLDNKINSSPAFNTSTIESCIMYRQNKTDSWLSEKTEEEKNEVINNARRNSSAVVEKIRQEKRNLTQERMEVIKERQEAVKQKREKKDQAVNKAMEYIKEQGLWESRERIESEMEKYQTKKDKMAALKKQINLYKTVFPVSNDDKHLLLFSSKGKQFGAEKLLENLTQLINKTSAINDAHQNVKDFPKASSLVGKTFEHIWTDNGEDSTWKGKILSFKKGKYEVKYWLAQEEEGDLFELTLAELKTDFVEGNLHFD